MTPKQAHRRMRLASDLLEEGQLPEALLAELRAYVVRLRQYLGRPGIVWNVQITEDEESEQEAEQQKQGER